MQQLQRTAPDCLLKAGGRALQLAQDGHLEGVPPDVVVVFLARAATPATLQDKGGAPRCLKPS